MSLVLFVVIFARLIEMATVAVLSHEAVEQQTRENRPRQVHCEDHGHVGARNHLPGFHREIDDRTVYQSTRKGVSKVLKPGCAVIIAICSDQIQRTEQKHLDHAHNLQPPRHIKEQRIKLVVKEPYVSYVVNQRVFTSQRTRNAIPLATEIIQRFKYQRHKAKQTIPAENK